MEYLTMTIREQKNIALIAHDGKKQEMLQWCIANREILKKHHLCGTGTTARMITEQAGLSVKGYNSGPLGGDQQVGAKIVEGQIDMSRHCSGSPRFTISRLPTTRQRQIF